MRNEVKISVLIVTLMIAGCSAAPKRPGSGRSGADAVGRSDDPIGGGDQDNPIVDPQKLTDVTNKIVASSYPQCNTDKPVETNSRPTLRLLTRTEYQNSVAALFSLSKNFGDELSPEQKTLGFSNNSDINMIGDTQMASYINVAREIARTAITTASSQLSCRSGATCAQTLIDDLAPRVWRRPLDPAEKARLLALYKVASVDGEPMGLEVLLTGMLASPHFLYRSEIGKSGKLSAHEAASALSYFFWASPPDEELRKLADNGTILDPKILAAQASRLLTSPNAKVGLNEVSEAYLKHSSVLGANKNAEKFKDFTPALKASLNNEAKNTFDYWVRTKGMKFGDLFTAETTVGDDSLVQFYQASATEEGNVKVINFSNSKRRGILGFASILSSLATPDESHPILRGLYVREQLLCQTLPPTPPSLVVSLPPAKVGTTTRDRFAAHTAKPECAGCHNLIDGVGFGMEDYDTLGRFRDKDGDLVVDASGNIVGLDGVDEKFSGVSGMSQVLKNSNRAKRCLVLQVFRQAAGRYEAENEVCGIRKIADEFIEKDLPLSDLLLSVITNPIFLKRGP